MQNWEAPSCLPITFWSACSTEAIDTVPALKGQDHTHEYLGSLSASFPFALRALMLISQSLTSTSNGSIKASISLAPPMWPSTTQGSNFSTTSSSRSKRLSAFLYTDLKDRAFLSTCSTCKGKTASLWYLANLAWLLDVAWKLKRFGQEWCQSTNVCCQKWWSTLQYFFSTLYEHFCFLVQFAENLLIFVLVVD